MTTEAECYRILGIEPGATMAELRAAYRRAACLYHPDLRKDDESFEAERKLRELIAAYKFLARRLDPAAWNHRGDNAKTYTPQDFARQGYRRQQNAEEFIDAQVEPRLFARLGRKDAHPTRDETQTFVVLWIIAVVVGIAFGGIVATCRAHALGVDELPPAEILTSILVAEGLYALLIAAAVIGVVLTRKLVRIALLSYRWLFLPGLKPDHTLPRQAKRIDGN